MAYLNPRPCSDRELIGPGGCKEYRAKTSINFLSPICMYHCHPWHNIKKIYVMVVGEDVNPVKEHGFYYRVDWRDQWQRQRAGQGPS